MCHKLGHKCEKERTTEALRASRVSQLVHSQHGKVFLSALSKGGGFLNQSALTYIYVCSFHDPSIIRFYPDEEQFRDLGHQSFHIPACRMVKY